MPSKEEFNVMRNNVYSVANLRHEYYWSSSEESAKYAYYNWGTVSYENLWSTAWKGITGSGSTAIRAVRDF